MTAPIRQDHRVSATPTDPLLRLDDPELEWKRFERFCLDLVRALPDVIDAHLYGTRGEDQQGIDIHADLDGGGVRTIQCRRVQKFGKGDARQGIKETTYKADEHEIWATAPLSTGARKQVDETDGWEARDIEQLSSLVRGLLREQARWLVEDHLGAAERKRFLGHEGDLLIAPALPWFRRADGRTQLLGLGHTLRGREQVLDELKDAVGDGETRIVILLGRSGIGKSRLLRALVEELPTRRILALRAGFGSISQLGDELPLDPYDLLIDDAHRRDDLQAVLATVLAAEALDTLVLASSPQGLSELRAILSTAGVSSDVVRAIGPLASLEEDEAEALAAEELTTAGADAGEAAQLARLTRDVPALCVLGARLLADGKLTLAAISADQTLGDEILVRYREETLGRLSDRVDTGLATRLLTLIAVLAPVDLDQRQTLEWLAAETSTSVEDAIAAIATLQDADLLSGDLRKRVVPELLADQLLYEATTGAGKASDFPLRLVTSGPEMFLGQIVRNLAELHAQLLRAGGPGILDPVTDWLLTSLVRAPACERERLLERLNGAAAYLAEWIVGMARELLDHPAAESPLFGEMVITDADARQRLVPLLAEAGLDLEQTEAAIHLLWEIGADLRNPNRWVGEAPLDALRSLGSYRLPLAYAEALLTVAESLLGDPPQAEARAIPAAQILKDLVVREGTTSRSQGYTVRLGAYFVNAESTAELRGRLREILTREALGEGERTRVVCAGHLASMLTQPRGYFGGTAPSEVIDQWRPEQLALIKSIDAIFIESDDPLVTRRLRDALSWHAEHSAIEGVRERAGEVLERHPVGEPELLVRAMTYGLSDLAKRDERQARLEELVNSLLADYPDPDPLLEQLDLDLDRLRTCEPELSADPGRLLAACAVADVGWGLSAARLLAANPKRPTARALAALTTVVLATEPEAARELVSGLAAGDVDARRIAADHIARMAWAGDELAPERDLAVKLASDPDPRVAAGVLLAAARVAEADPDLARRIVLAVPSLAEPQLAEEACMALHPRVELTEGDWEVLLGRLRSCPEVEYWYEQMLAKASAAVPRVVVDHLLGRALDGGDDGRLSALPFDGLSFDPFAEHPEMRPEALERVAAALGSVDGGVAAMELPRLFWAAGAEDESPFELIAKLLSGGEERADTGRTLLLEASHRRLLARPEWISTQIEASDPGDPLDQLRSALRASLHSRTRQGTPGEPYPEDVALRDKAKALAEQAATASRSERFWLDVASSVEAEIEEELRRDRLLVEDD